MRLFYEDEFDAIATAIGNSGKPFKDIAREMFPDMKPESAYARLKACCSSEGDQRLTFGQTIRLMKYLNNYDPLLFACDETLHARPDRKAAKDEEVRLVEAINGAADVMRRGMGKLEALKRGAA